MAICHGGKLSATPSRAAMHGQHRGIQAHAPPHPPAPGLQPLLGSVIWKCVLRFGGTLVAGLLGLGALYFSVLCNGLSFEDRPAKVCLPEACCCPPALPQGCRAAPPEVCACHTPVGAVARTMQRSSVVQLRPHFVPWALPLPLSSLQFIAMTAALTVLSMPLAAGTAYFGLRNAYFWIVRWVGGKQAGPCGVGSAGCGKRCSANAGAAGSWPRPLLPLTSPPYRPRRHAAA